MRQVTVLESFNDIEQAFASVRPVGSPERIEQYAKLYISEDGRMTLNESKLFVLGDSIREQGHEFIEWCVKRVIPNYKGERYPS